MIYEEKKAGAEFSEAVVQLCQKVDMGLEAIAEVEAQIEAAKAEGKETTVEESIVEDDIVDSADVVVEEHAEVIEAVTEETTEAE